MTIDEGIESLVRSAESQAATLRNLLEMINLLDERITALEDNNEPTAQRTGRGANGGGRTAR